MLKIMLKPKYHIGKRPIGLSIFINKMYNNRKIIYDYDRWSYQSALNGFFLDILFLLPI